MVERTIILIAWREGGARLGGYYIYGADLEDFRKFDR